MSRRSSDITRCSAIVFCFRRNGKNGPLEKPTMSSGGFPMAKKTRKRFTAQEKVAILRLHLLEHTPISDLCDQHGIHPTMFYRWQKEFFENGSAAPPPRSRHPARGHGPAR